MILVVPFVAFSSLLEPRAAGDLIYRACFYWDAAWMTAIGIRHTNIPGHRPDPATQYIFVANHISYLDIPLILRAIRHHSFRILGKAEMRRMPLFGYIYSRAVVMVDRSSSGERSRSVRELRAILARGVSVFIFPEGTFNETRQPLKEFYDGAFRLAIETATPIQPILFPDTYHRMHYSSIFTLNPGRSRAFFLPEVPVTGLTLDDLPALKDKVYRLMAAELIRQGAPWIDPLPNA